MPTRSRQANTRAAAQVEEEEAAYSIPGLDYTEALSWPAGRPIPVADLFTRLQKLSGVLKATEQGSVEVKDVAKLAHDLAHSNLLGHKDKGIRAWTVACVVDILNLCAPNAPYRPNQLKEIFTTIIYTILPALADPSNAYNTQHQYVLDQLVDTQSIVLVTDLQDADHLIGQMFTVCFDVVSGSGKNTAGMELAQSVVFQLTMLLNTVVDEANLPEEVVDIILSQFLRVDPRTVQAPSGGKKKTVVKDKTQSTLILKDYPPAYNLAKSVCTACSEKISTAISQYFSTIITTASAGGMTGQDGRSKASTKRLQNDDSSEDDEDSFKDIRKAHRLVKELWRACPDVLTNVVPQIELELAADAIRLRELATTTVGDLVAGIGLAGLPDLSALDPAAFPLPTVENADLTVLSSNPLLKPLAPKPFIHVHANTYQAFMGRRIDKAVEVRVAWVQAAARILLTRAGGIGLGDEELSVLLTAYTRMLKDIDEKVRSAALTNLEGFPYHTVIQMLGSDGGLSVQTSLLSTIAERVTDKKQFVRNEAMVLLGSMWGVASRDIGNGNERVCAILGQAPTRLLSAMFVKDANITMKLPEVLFEQLLPYTYPPIKGKVAISETQGDGDVSEYSVDPDTLRVRRLVTLVRDLDDKAKAVFFGLQKRQADMQKGMTQFLDACEKYNGGVADSAADEQALNEALTRYVASFARLYPDPTKASGDLWKFVKANDRRNYQLIKFAMGAEQDYRTMYKAIRELKKRLSEAANTGSVLATLNPLIYQSAMINYNRSHIAAIMGLTKSADTALADVAQEILKQISEKVPEVMKSHIEVLCKELEEAAPSDKGADIFPSTDSLKACSAFAKKFPDDLPKDRKFVAAMQAYVLHSNFPTSAKHAVTIILTAFDKKELRSKEILSKAIKRYKTNPRNLVTQLAAIAQACRLAPAIGESEESEILNIANITLESGERHEAEYRDSAWSENVDEHTTAKQWALMIYVNRCRRVKADEQAATEAISKLTDIIKNDGETVPGDSSSSSPSVQRNQLRLASARYLLKICRHRQLYESMVTPQMFQTVAWILASPPYGVRGGLVRQLKKYLSADQLSSRWLTLLFLLPFEPDEQLRASTIAWLKSRLAHYTRLQQSNARANGEKKGLTTNVMESAFTRLFSLLAHHPDFPAKSDPDYNGQLLDFANYFIFYLRSVATEDNLSLIFHIAQRIKQAADAITQTSEVDEHLYVLSDLAQATIRNYADSMPGSAKGMNILQAWPGKAHLPNNLFQAIKGSSRAQEIASKNYLPEEVAIGLETLVRRSIRNIRFSTSTKAKASGTDKKRKSSVSVDLDDEEAESVRKSTKKSRSAKKPSRTSLTIRETPNSKKRKNDQAMSVEQPSRKSARTSTAKKVSYEESDEDDEEGDADDIVKYKPAPMEKYKHKMRERDAATPDIEEEDEEEDDAKERNADEEEAGSPTPAGKAQESEEADIDVEMTNGDHEEEPAEDDAEVEDENEDEEVEAEEQAEEQESEQGEEDEEEAEAEPSPPPATKRGGRSTRAKETPKSAPASTRKTQTKAVSRPAETPASNSKITKKTSKEKAAQPASSPPPESARRSSRRSKAGA